MQIASAADLTNTGQAQRAMLPMLAKGEFPAVAMGLEADSGKARARLEARDAGRVSRLNAP